MCEEENERKEMKRKISESGSAGEEWKIEQ
jgi:hypothetical protein